MGEIDTIGIIAVQQIFEPCQEVIGLCRLQRELFGIEARHVFKYQFNIGHNDVLLVLVIIACQFGSQRFQQRDDNLSLPFIHEQGLVGVI